MAEKATGSDATSCTTDEHVQLLIQAEPACTPDAQLQNLGPGPKVVSSHQHSTGLTVDEALTKHVGEFGKGQILVFVLASLGWVPNAVIILLLVFSVGTPIKNLQWRCVSQSDSQCMNTYHSDDPMQGFCSMSSSQWHWTHRRASLTAEFDLVCANAWKGQVANSFFFFGYLIGSGVFGSLADSQGRKKCLFGGTLLAGLFQSASMAATNYWVFLCLRALTGIGIAGQALGAYVLATEMIGPSWRGAAGICTQIFFILGEFALVVFALMFKSWRSLTGAACVLNAAFLLLWPLLPESGRWLLVQGHKQECMQVYRAAWSVQLLVT